MDRLDMRGVEIKIGDRVVYGKSDRNRPIKIGTVKDIVDFENRTDFHILGDGNSKVGEIANSKRIKRILVLPKEY